MEAGDSIPADARLIRAFVFGVQEAALTGESVPVAKDAVRVLDPASPLGDRLNMVYMGTTVAAGKADAVVVATGMDTELGRIAGMLGYTEREPTPLQRRLAELGKILIAIVLGIVALIFFLRLLRGGALLESFLLSVSLAVAAVPEGLPAVVTLTLAMGLQRLVRRNALIRKLPSVETLGSVTVICSDKTGTLTRNEMTVREVVTGSAHYHVSGAGYDPLGAFHLRGKGDERGHGEAIDPRDWPDLMRALHVAAWCNTAQVVPRSGDDGGWQVIGDPTEGALVVAARKAEVHAHGRDDRLLHEIPFDSDRKAMSVVVRGPDGSATMYTKGAPEVILGKCKQEWRHGRIEPLTPERLAEVLHTATEMASRALRVLALADRQHPDSGHEATRREEDLVFVGLVGMIDPPREEVRVAVHTCQEAGIRPIMITGDHPATALAIARELGIAREHDRALTGQQLDEVERRGIGVDRRGSLGLRSRLGRAQAACRAGLEGSGAGRGDDRRRRQRRPRRQGGRHRHRHGHHRHRRDQGGVRHGPDRRQLRLDRQRRRGGARDLRQHPEVHPLPAREQRQRGTLHAVRRPGRLAGPADGGPAPVDQPRDRRPARAGPRRGTARARHHATPPPTAARASDHPTRRAAHPLPWASSWRRWAWWPSLSPTAVARTSIGREPPRSARWPVTQLFFSFACRSQRYTLPQLGLFSNPYLFWAIAASALLQFTVVTLPLTHPVFDIPAHPGGDWLYILPLALVPVTVVEVAKMLHAGFAARRAARPTTGS